MRWRVSWLGGAVATCLALGCGGRTERDAVPGAGAGDAGAGGAGGVHSVLVACELCGVAELTCTGTQISESQSIFRQNLTGDSCDYEPAAGFAGPALHVACKGGQSVVTCTVGYCNKIDYADGVLGFENLDGSFAFTCRGPSGVK